jgi:hypothetical protein
VRRQPRQSVTRYGWWRRRRGFDGNLHLACEEVAQKKLFKLMN